MPTRNQHKQRGCEYCDRYAIACCGAWNRATSHECGIPVCEDHQQRVNGTVFCLQHQSRGVPKRLPALQQIALFSAEPHTHSECSQCYRPAVAEQGGQLVCKQHRKRKQARDNAATLNTSPLFERGDFIDL